MFKVRFFLHQVLFSVKNQRTQTPFFKLLFKNNNQISYLIYKGKHQDFSGAFLSVWHDEIPIRITYKPARLECAP